MFCIVFYIAAAINAHLESIRQSVEDGNFSDGKYEF